MIALDDSLCDLGCSLILVAQLCDGDFVLLSLGTTYSGMCRGLCVQLLLVDVVCDVIMIVIAAGKMLPVLMLDSTGHLCVVRFRSV